MKNTIRRGLATTVVLAATGAGALVAAPSATATDAATVCAQNLYVRYIPQGVVIGTLYKGDHFAIDHYSPTRQYVYGHAYGNVHKDGWVQNGWFC